MGGQRRFSRQRDILVSYISKQGKRIEVVAGPKKIYGEVSPGAVTDGPRRRGKQRYRGDTASFPFRTEVYSERRVAKIYDETDIPKERLSHLLNHLDNAAQHKLTAQELIEDIDTFVGQIGCEYALDDLD